MTFQEQAKKDAFLERLSRGPILGDGAMGTQLYSRGGLTFDQCFDELNASRPDLVREVHLDYLQAGAEIIETNTFGANRLRLEAHGLVSRVGELNAKGVAIAREARRLTGTTAWIAGSVGPTGRALAPLGPLSRTQAKEAFREQIDALVAAEVDVLFLETFPSLTELEVAVQAAQEVCDLPVVTQMTFSEEGTSPFGDAPFDVAQRLHALGVTVGGANCSVGSLLMQSTIESMSRERDLLLVAQPNAGFPRYVHGRYVYVASPEYMADYARHMVEMGVSIIGGCCGTTPEHVAALRDVVAAPVTTRRLTKAPAIARPAGEKAESRLSPVAPHQEPTQFSQKLGHKFVVNVEVDPPKGFDISETLARLRQLQGAGLVDAVNIADNPRAQGRMSALAASALVQGRLGIETVMHMTTRHRNLLALHSELLGAHAFGVRNLFVVRGDPPSVGDYPKAAALSDITPTGLIQLIKGFNKGTDALGHSLEQPTTFVAGAALNLSPSDLDKELQLMERKVKAGADFFLTQPVYDLEVLEQWQKRIGTFPLPLIMGVLPLRSLRHAEFLHNEVPGMVVPAEVRDRLRRTSDRQADEGIRISQELLLGAAGRISGAYVMPPFHRYQIVADLLLDLVGKLPGLGEPLAEAGG